MLEKEKPKVRKLKSVQTESIVQESNQHPDHSAHIKSLNRIKGQIEGIERMILDRRYCTDIVAQLKAAAAGLKTVESEVFKSHLRGCVKSAFKGNDPYKAEEKIQEIIKLIY